VEGFENELGQSCTDGTVGWYPFRIGMVGVTNKESLLLSVVNTGSASVTVACGNWQNPRVVEDSYALQSGDSKHCDGNGSEISKEHFDKSGRVQLRRLVRSSARTGVTAPYLKLRRTTYHDRSI
jgi:hypothetical protein